MKKKLLYFSTIVLIAYFSFPSIIHFTLQKLTTSDRIAYCRIQYHGLANEQDYNKNQKELNELYLWFHVRGLQIDEGHDGISTYERCKEIYAWIVLNY